MGGSQGGWQGELDVCPPELWSEPAKDSGVAGTPTLGPCGGQMGYADAPVLGAPLQLGPRGPLFLLHLERE